MAMPATAKVLDLQSLGSVTLRPGDNDAKRIWGGSIQPTSSGTPVKQLQTALIALGALTFPADGQFGPHTRQALHRFQWYVSNIRFRLKLSPGTQPAAGIITLYPECGVGNPGLCNAAVANVILSWRVGNFVTSTPLVRLDTRPLSNVETADTFETLAYPSAKGGEVLLHADFAQFISSVMNSEAKKAGVTLRINQTFRRSDSTPSGAVVTPAKKSQHLVGHAVDLNIVDGKTVNTAAMFITGDQTKAANTFVTGVKTNCKDLRWGGDFSEVDPVHFDDFLNPKGEDFEMTFFFVQQSFRAGHPMRVVT